MRMKKHKKGAGGYSLLEMLGYVAVLAIGINLCGSLLITGNRITSVVTGQLDAIHGIEETEQLFVNAVHCADGLEEHIGGYTAGVNTLILRSVEPDGSTRYILLGNLMGPHCFSRMDLVSRNGKLELDSMKTAGQMVEYCRFSADTSNAVPVMSMTLKRKAEQGEPENRIMEHHFMATPRGIAGAAMATSEGNLS